MKIPFGKPLIGKEETLTRMNTALNNLKLSHIHDKSPSRPPEPIEFSLKYSLSFHLLSN